MIVRTVLDREPPVEVFVEGRYEPPDRVSKWEPRHMGLFDIESAAMADGTLVDLSPLEVSQVRREALGYRGLR